MNDALAGCCVLSSKLGSASRSAADAALHGRTGRDWAGKSSRPRPRPLTREEMEAVGLP